MGSPGETLQIVGLWSPRVSLLCVRVSVCGAISVPFCDHCERMAQYFFLSLFIGFVFTSRFGDVPIRQTIKGMFICSAYEAMWSSSKLADCCARYRTLCCRVNEDWIEKWVERKGRVPPNDANVTIPMELERIMIRNNLRFHPVGAWFPKVNECSS